ncbi:MAG: glyoxylate/hydroxypyruvate reductase A [Rhodobacteraceae bacterium]|nr:glyoxylate/hydroxypyruvate reductase A [Paracoccaceae bacterium]
MPVNVLFAGNPKTWPDYREALPAAFRRKGVAANLLERADDPGAVDYIVYAPNGGLSDFTPFTGLKAVLSLWAGVETFQDNATLTVPLARMVDFGLTEGMAEWVLGQVMRYHLGNDLYVLNQDGIWRNGDFVPPLARHRNVGILGLGELGLAAARMLKGVGFSVHGWSRSAKSEPGITCHSGMDGLREVLAKSEILVLLLPLTAATEHLLDAARLAMLPRGAYLINPGRGPLIDDAALLAALDTGQVAHATLDVFRVEPLPPAHPFWAHPNVTVTPHIASETRAESASDTIAENVRRGEAGEPFLYLVDRKAGY